MPARRGDLAVSAPVSPASAALRRLAAALFSAAALLGATVEAQEAVNRKPVPDPVSAALRAAAIPPGSSAIVVLPLSPGGVTIEANESTPMNPASTMKLVTTYAALDLLGPAYTSAAAAIPSWSSRACG